MNNQQLTEKLYVHLVKNSSVGINEEVYERTLYGGPLQFIKDSAKTLLQIKKLKPEDELLLDLVEPTGFLSIIKNEDETFTMTLVLKGQKSLTYKVDKATTVMKRVVELLKDQMTVGRKNLKAQYKK